MFCTIATVQVKEGQLDQFLRYMRGGLIARARKMEGCHDFAMYVDQELDAESAAPTRENVVTLVGKWADLETWKAHRESSQMFELRWDATELVEDLSVRLLTEV